MSDSDVKRKLPEFHPCLFADGECDDTLGFKALMENKTFIYGDQIFKPGESFSLSNHTFLFSKKIVIVSSATPVCINPSNRGEITFIHIPPDGRRVELAYNAYLEYNNDARRRK